MTLIVLVDQSVQVSVIFAKEIEAVTSRARAFGGKVIPVIPHKEGTWGCRVDDADKWTPLDDHPDLRGAAARIILITDGMSNSMLGKSLVSCLNGMAPGTLLFILHPWSGTEWRRSRLGALLPGHHATPARRKRPGAVVPIFGLSTRDLSVALRRKSTRGAEYSVTLEEDDSALERLNKNSARLDRSRIDKFDLRVRTGMDILPSATMELVILAAVVDKPLNLAQIRHLGEKFGYRQGTVEPHELALSVTTGFLTWNSPDEAKRGENALLRITSPGLAKSLRKRIPPQLVGRVLEATSGWAQEQPCASSD